MTRNELIKLVKSDQAGVPVVHYKTRHTPKNFIDRQPFEDQSGHIANSFRGFSDKRFVILVIEANAGENAPAEIVE